MQLPLSGASKGRSDLDDNRRLAAEALIDRRFRWRRDSPPPIGRGAAWPAGVTSLPNGCPRRESCIHSTTVLTVCSAAGNNNRRQYPTDSTFKRSCKEPTSIKAFCVFPQRSGLLTHYPGTLPSIVSVAFEALLIPSPRFRHRLLYHLRG